MVYIIMDSEKKRPITMVKADSKEDVDARLHLRETERIAGILTDIEVSILSTSTFVVINA